MRNPVLRLEGIEKRFGGVRALAGVSLEVMPGEIHGLVGENGAGKSTLIAAASGAVAPDRGTVEIAGRMLERADPAVARRLGLAVVRQSAADDLFPQLSVAENIAVGIEPARRFHWINWRNRRRRAAELLELAAGKEDGPAWWSRLDRPVSQLSSAELQSVEIAKAVGADAKALVLDEPTASMSDRQTRALFDLLHRLRRKGVGIVYVTHRLGELFELADRVTVLRDGSLVATRPVGEVDRDSLVRMMVGREVPKVDRQRVAAPRHGDRAGEKFPPLELIGVRAGPRFGPIDLHVNAGEIVGLAGLVGAGRTRLARLLFGLDRMSAGEVRIAGRTVSLRTPGDAVAAGLAYVPEDRRRHGIVAGMSVAQNLTLADLRRVSSGPWIDRGMEQRLAKTLVDRLRVKCSGIDAEIGTLSGGNQQKVAFGRWLSAVADDRTSAAVSAANRNAGQPRIWIFDEPTQGVDVGAKSEIHALVREQAAKQAAVLLISSEIEELLAVADRIVVMAQGAIVGDVPGEAATPETILELALRHAGDAVQDATSTPSAGSKFVGESSR